MVAITIQMENVVLMLLLNAFKSSTTFFYSIPDCWAMFNFLSSCISCILTLSSSENEV